MPIASKFHTPAHNHAHCIREAIEKAARLCQQQNIRFTPIRQRVLELVWESHQPIVAYDLLKSLRKEKTNAEAPTVYRALDFLLAHGLAHKIESLNAFVGCAQPETKHVSQFLICTDCRQAVELDNARIQQAIEQQAGKTGFRIREQTIEIKGICPECQT